MHHRFLSFCTQFETTSLPASDHLKLGDLAEELVAGFDLGGVHRFESLGSERLVSTIFVFASHFALFLADKLVAQCKKTPKPPQVFASGADNLIRR
jgi:hypothetical protein